MKQRVHELLETLLKKADKAPGKNVRLGKAEKAMKAYIDNEPIGISETLHQEFKRLEAAGIVAIKWHNPNVLVQFIELLDADALAEQIGYRRLGNRYEQAKRQVESQLEDSVHFNVIKADLLSKWQSTGKFEGFTVDEPQELIDAVNAADAMLALLETDTGEIDERHFSTRVFADSKKLKSLHSKIARVIRLRDSDIPDELEHHEVFQLFGVVPIKHPIYVTGAITLIADNEKSASADFPPCVGVWPDHVISVKENNPISIITSIENFATYMRYVESEKRAYEVVLYTAGIPSPAFRRFYRLLTSTVPEAALRHWGDIDVGGFTILHILEKTASRPVQGYRMSSLDYNRETHYDTFSKAETSRLRKIAGKMSDFNHALITAGLSDGKKFEQEAFFNLSRNQ